MPLSLASAGLFSEHCLQWNLVFACTYRLFTLSREILCVVELFTLLLSLFLGITLTLRTADFFWNSQPLNRLLPRERQIRDVIIDQSALEDERVLISLPQSF